MPRLIKMRSERAGLPPGALVYLGEKRAERAAVSVTDYTETDVSEKTVQTAEECRHFVDKPSVTWINVTGLHDIGLLQEFGEMLDIHPLILENILTTGQRAKTEDHGDYIFVAAKMLRLNPKNREVISEQVSLVLGQGYVLSFQEAEGDVFDVVRERIHTAKGRIRKMGSGYLGYALLDAIVDNYFVILEEMGEKIDRLQDDVIQKTGSETLQAIHRLKSDMVFMRKNLWPLREAVSVLEKADSPILGDSMGPYLRDVYEHTIQVMDGVESLRDMLSGTLDVYMSSVSNRMNEVMKVLTVIATIFIPLTFIAGIYGMNFQNMPELKWPLGYPAVCAVMVVLGVGMARFFKRRKWF